MILSKLITTSNRHGEICGGFVVLSERMRSVGRTRNEAIRQLGEFCKVVAIWGYRHRSHSQKAKHHKVLLDAKPMYAKHGGCVTKGIRDNAQRTSPVSLDKPTHTMAKDYTINVGIDTTDAVATIFKLKKSLQDNITDLHGDDITTGTIDALGVKVTNKKKRVPELEVVVYDDASKPELYLCGKRVNPEGYRIEYKENDEGILKSFWQIYYSEQYGQS